MHRILTGLLLCFSLALNGCGARLSADQSQAASQAVILSPTQNAFLVFDLRTNRVRYRIPTGAVPYALEMGPGGLVFIAHQQESSFSVFQRASPGNYYTFGKIGTPGRPEAMAYNPVFQEIYIVSQPRVLSVYRMQGLKQPRLQQTLRLDANIGVPHAMSVSGDGQRLFIAGQVLESLSRENDQLKTAKTLDLPENSRISDMVLREQTLYLADQDLDKLYMVASDDLSLSDTIDLVLDDQRPILPRHLAINHAGTKLYLTGQGASVVQVIDLADKKLAQTLELNQGRTDVYAGSPNGIAIQADDRRVYITAQNGRNIVILESSPDAGQEETIEKLIGTTASAALLPPLGAIRIF